MMTSSISRDASVAAPLQPMLRCASAASAASSEARRVFCCLRLGVDKNGTSRFTVKASLRSAPHLRTSARRPEHPKLSPMPTLVHQCFRASSTSSALTVRAHPHAGICWPWGAHTPLHSSSDCAASGRPSPPSRPWHGVLHGWRRISARRTCCGALSPTGRPARTRALLHAPALCAICVCSRPCPRSCASSDASERREWQYRGRELHGGVGSDAQGLRAELGGPGPGRAPDVLVCSPPCPAHRPRLRDCASGEPRAAGVAASQVKTPWQLRR